MKDLFTNIRFYILLFSITFSVGAYFFIISSAIMSPQTQVIRLEQIYALTAIIYLYLALLAGPFCYTFPAFPLKAEYLKARRALGVSAFYFALIHASFAFFGQLGGFAGIPFLNDRYLLAIACSFIALIILSLLAATSFDAVIKKMTFPRWKFLQRFVYLAGVLILIHALMLGTHFSDLSATIPLLLFFFIGFLFVLEGQRIDVFLHKKINLNPRFHVSLLIIIVLMGVIFFKYVNPFGSKSSSINIHSQHLSHSKGNPVVLDNGKKLMVHLLTSEPFVPNQETKLVFQIHDADSKAISSFDLSHEKLLHLIIVDSQLNYFKHVHPEFDGSQFSVTTKFPQSGRYYLFFDFQSEGKEQKLTSIVSVGENITPEPANNIVDTRFTKTVGNYKVTLQSPSLQAKRMSEGKQRLSFMLDDATTGAPVKTLKPYLGSYGHLVMINEKTYQYLHIHPVQTSKKGHDGGPSVSFIPLGLNEPVTPGIYRVFAQFNPNDELITVDFTVQVN